MKEQGASISRHPLRFPKRCQEWGFASVSNHSQALTIHFNPIPANPVSHAASQRRGVWEGRGRMKQEEEEIMGGKYEADGEKEGRKSQKRKEKN